MNNHPVFYVPRHNLALTLLVVKAPSNGLKIIIIYSRDVAVYRPLPLGARSPSCDRTNTYAPELIYAY